MMRFSNRLVAERVQRFWEALQAGEFLTDAAALAGTHRWRGLTWLREAGGVRPRRGREGGVCRLRSVRRLRWAAPAVRR